MAESRQHYHPLPAYQPGAEEHEQSRTPAVDAAASQAVLKPDHGAQRGEYSVRENSMAKLHASRVAVEVADEWIRVHGGAG